jgi:hypothetical protein
MYQISYMTMCSKYSNKEWVKRITSLIPAIMVHVPLLLAAIATATNDKKPQSFLAATA